MNEKVNAETLNLIRIANPVLSGLLAQIPAWLADKNGLPLGEIQNAVATADGAISSVGRSLGSARSAGALDAESNAETRRYVENLKELKSFLIYLHAYAETRRKELRRDAGKFAEFTAWAETVKLTLASPE